MNQPLELYLAAFKKLHVDKSKGSPAPHKPILLLSVLDGVASGEITENMIHVTASLVACFKDYWRALEPVQMFKPNFYYPFYHLKSEKFWHLSWLTAKEFIPTSSHSVGSFHQLLETVDYAYLDQPLFDLMADPVSNFILKQALLEKWFNQPVEKIVAPVTIPSIANQILHDSPHEYRAHTNLADDEEVFVRGGVFKRLVPQLYDSTCCISGMKIIATANVQMVDACHIIPFSVTHDDTITNGLTLCPNLHRAFDRGLIGLNDYYEVVIGSRFANEAASSYAISQYIGKTIILPTDNNYHPSPSNLLWHRQKWNIEG